MDYDKQALAPSAPGQNPADTFYPPMENPPPYSPMYPDPSKFQTQQHQHQHMTMPQAQAGFAAPVHQQPGQAPPQTIIQIVNAPLPEFGPRSVSITCPYCAASIQTSVRKRYTGLTHFMAGMLCFMCLCCFAWTPYFCDCFNEFDHTCPNCNKYLGVCSTQRYNRYRRY